MPMPMSSMPTYISGAGILFRRFRLNSSLRGLQTPRAPSDHRQCGESSVAWMRPDHCAGCARRRREAPRRRRVHAHARPSTAHGRQICRGLADVLAVAMPGCGKADRKLVFALQQPALVVAVTSVGAARLGNFLAARWGHILSCTQTKMPMLLRAAPLRSSSCASCQLLLFSNRLSAAFVRKQFGYRPPTGHRADTICPWVRCLTHAPRSGHRFSQCQDSSAQTRKSAAARSLFTPLSHRKAQTTKIHIKLHAAHGRPSPQRTRRAGGPARARASSTSSATRCRSARHSALNSAGLAASRSARAWLRSSTKA